MVKAQRGDIVRIVVEGRVTDTLDTDTYGRAVAVNGFEYYPDWPGASVKKIKVIERNASEPDWAPGDVVKVPDYTPFTRRSDSSWTSSGVSGPSSATIARLVSRAWADRTLKVLYGQGVATDEG